MLYIYICIKHGPGFIDVVGFSRNYFCPELLADMGLRAQEVQGLDRGEEGLIAYSGRVIRKS